MQIGRPNLVSSLATGSVTNWVACRESAEIVIIALDYTCKQAVRAMQRLQESCSVIKFVICFCKMHEKVGSVSSRDRVTHPARAAGVVEEDRKR